MELKELIKKKEKIEEEIKKKKMEMNNKTNGANIQLRVSTKFNDYLNFIIKERLRLGIDSLPLSKPKITNFLVTHKHSGTIQNDCINFKEE